MLEHVGRGEAEAGERRNAAILLRRRREPRCVYRDGMRRQIRR